MKRESPTDTYRNGCPFYVFGSAIFKCEGASQPCCRYHLSRSHQPDLQHQEAVDPHCLLSTQRQLLCPCKNISAIVVQKLVNILGHTLLMIVKLLQKPVYNMNRDGFAGFLFYPMAVLIPHSININ